jgi:hypothetical protein
MNEIFVLSSHGSSIRHRVTEPKQVPVGFSSVERKCELRYAGLGRNI